MRGSLAIWMAMASAVGIIPAHAGLTEAGLAAFHGIRDHPRACGAHDFEKGKVVEKEGSSPRMRGSRLAERSGKHFAGIIPAHAGLTRPYVRISVRLRDHPRACGAHVRFTGRAEPDFGIIPAHAGLTRLYTDPESSSRDHPRACGAHRIKRLRRMKRPGSSPRMRGSHRGREDAPRHRGIIPAHAGLTPRPRRRASSPRDHPRACGAHAKNKRKK